MQIREGAYYRTRGGQVFGPMMRWVEPNTNYPWCVCFTEHENCWTEAGCWSVNGREYPFDLVAEVYVSDTLPTVTETEEELREMMRDPRYWRAREPEFVKRVTDGFRALVGGGAPPATGPNGAWFEVHDRKTLRDEFAMALMDADDFMVGFKEHAEQLYRAADAMMEARKK